MVKEIEYLIPANLKKVLHIIGAQYAKKKHQKAKNNLITPNYISSKSRMICPNLRNPASLPVVAISREQASRCPPGSDLSNLPTYITADFLAY